MTTNEVVVLDGDEVKQCPECCAPAFCLHSRYYANETHYYLRADIECEQGHTRTVVDPPQPMDDEMRELLGAPQITDRRNDT